MGTRLMRCSLLIAAWVAATAASPALGNHGRFLPDAGTGFILSYGDVGGGGNPSTFDNDILCDGVKVGTIKFDYDTYLESPAPATGGGGALSGGFYLDAGKSVEAGHHLAWVQTVIATRSGANDWGIDPATNGGEFPDATRTSPEYPFTTTAAAPPNPPGAPTLGFQDFPNRLFANGNQSWLAELGLACVSDTADPTTGVTDVKIMATFLWGFGVTVGPNAITANAPHALGAPTQSYLDTLNSYYSGTPPNPPTSGGVSTKFSFSEGCCVVPEPSSIALVGLGLIGTAVAARRRARA